MIATTKQYFYPNAMGRIILTSFEEILGRENLGFVLKQAGMPDFIHSYPPDDMERGFDFAYLSQIMDALEVVYGPRAGRGLAMRAGRATFKHGLRKFGSLLGLDEMSFRLAPLDAKLIMGANLFARIFNEYSDQVVRVETTQGAIYWHIDRCPICWNRLSDAPLCHLAAGLLQEALYWASGGKFFKVEETACIAQGDEACSFRIEKQAFK